MKISRQNILKINEGKFPLGMYGGKGQMYSMIRTMGEDRA